RARSGSISALQAADRFALADTRGSGSFFHRGIRLFLRPLLPANPATQVAVPFLARRGGRNFPGHILASVLSGTASLVLRSGDCIRVLHDSRRVPGIGPWTQAFIAESDVASVFRTLLRADRRLPPEFRACGGLHGGCRLPAIDREQDPRTGVRYPGRYLRGGSWLVQLRTIR